MKRTITMTSEAFKGWLSAMKISDAEAARQLGVGKNAVTRYKRTGATKAISLACSALWHRLGEWQ